MRAFPRLLGRCRKRSNSLSALESIDKRPVSPAIPAAKEQGRPGSYRTGRASIESIPLLPSLPPLPGAVDEHRSSQRGPKVSDESRLHLQPASHLLCAPAPLGRPLRPVRPSVGASPPRSSPSEASPSKPRRRAISQVIGSSGRQEQNRSSPSQSLLASPSSSPGREAPKISITVVSALTGEVVATMSLPSTAMVATFKLEMEKITGKPAFSLSFCQMEAESSPCCLSDFDSLEDTLGGVAPATLAMVCAMPNQHSSQGQAASMALPFDALDRDYLPASGLVSSALGSAFPTSASMPIPAH